MSEAQLGEQLVGAYHKLVNQCEIVSYNQRSEQQGDQMEIDVLAIRSRNGYQRLYVCEVITHIHGMQYSGTPSSDRWAEYGNDTYQNTLERLLQKFEADHSYVTRVFDTTDEYVFQLWSPVVPQGTLTDGLAELQDVFENGTGHELELVINEEYSNRIDELREKASKDKKQYGEPAFRLLQILEHMR